MKVRRLIAVAPLLAFMLCANAQTMKPGLWEINQKMKFGSSEMTGAMAAMQDQITKMSPEQRKQMQDMMSKQGVNIDLGAVSSAGGPGALSVKTCMTPEMVARNELPTVQGNCTSINSPRVGNTMKMSFTCTKPPSSGEGQVTFVGPDAYTMKMTVTTTVKGKPESMDMDGSGKWLGASCGDVKPLVTPKN